MRRADQGVTVDGMTIERVPIEAGRAVAHAPGIGGRNPVYDGAEVFSGYAPVQVDP
jgi:hypothetical protein